MIHSGYLRKEGKSITSWKKRWFELTATELKYFGILIFCCFFLNVNRTCPNNQKQNKTKKKKEDKGKELLRTISLDLVVDEVEIAPEKKQIEVSKLKSLRQSKGVKTKKTKNFEILKRSLQLVFFFFFDL